MAMKHILASVFAGAMLTACETTGIGTGSTLQGDVHATLSWHSTGGHSGDITAQLNTGEVFSGRYFQISRETRVDELSPLWDGWGWPRNGWGMYWGRWGNWGYWGPSTGFVTTYSGRVVANLSGPNDTHMRCRFFLQYPASGMAGGGQGTCQLPNGTVIDTTFPSR
ncbi:MAG: hypothetical protein ACYCZX_18090 [Rhodospirillaceae bacterium]